MWSITYLFLFIIVVCGCSCNVSNRKGGLHDDSRPSMSPDGKSILFAANRAGKSNVYLMKVDGSGLTQLTTKGGYDPIFSPDGSKIAFISDRDNKGGKIYIMNSDGSNQTRLTYNEFHEKYPSFPPDGTRILFSRATLYRTTSTFGHRWDDWDIYVINTDGMEEQRLTHRNYNILRSPWFFPDKTTIIFSAELAPHDRNKSLDSSETIYLKDTIDEKPPVKLTEQYSTSPVLSPDGKKIVFIAQAGKNQYQKYNYEVFSMDYNGSNRAQLTYTHSYNWAPTFAPNGQTILFLSDPERDGTFTLWQVNVDGTNLRRIELPKEW